MRTSLRRSILLRIVCIREHLSQQYALENKKMLLKIHVFGIRWKPHMIYPIISHLKPSIDLYCQPINNHFRLTNLTNITHIYNLNQITIRKYSLTFCAVQTVVATAITINTTIFFAIILAGDLLE